MIELNAERLSALGYTGLTRDQVNKLLGEMYKAGEEIVGLKLANRMSEEELDAFNEFIDEGNDEAAFEWLKTHFPDYAELSETTFEELDEVLREAATQTRVHLGTQSRHASQVED